MASIRCKFCSAEMSVGLNEGMASCSVCGGRQSLPLSLDYSRSGLFVRGNHFRAAQAFSKGLRVYDRIITDYPDDAEAFFCRALCRYGVTFDIPNKPIVNCTRRQPFEADSDVRVCLNFSDAARGEYYKELIQRIGEAQRQVIEAATKIPPYDIYLVTDESAKSVELGLDLYMQLTEREYSVYYLQASRDRQVKPSEVYAYAALNSSKLMIPLGTQAEQFDNYMVRNAFERFIELQAEDCNKVLLPCYRDIDVFDLPEELSYAHSLDMGRINFIGELMNAVHSAMLKGSPLSKGEGMVGNSGSLLARAFLFLEDGDFGSASKYLERVLDLDAMSAHAYVGKLMVEKKLTAEQQLRDCTEPLDKDKNFVRALRFADPDYRAVLESYNDCIRERIERHGREQRYLDAVEAISTASTELEFLALEERFLTFGDYEDSLGQARSCRIKAAEARVQEDERRALEEKQQQENQKHKKELAKRNKEDEQKLIPLFELRDNLIAAYPSKKEGGLLGRKRRSALREIRRVQGEIDTIRIPLTERNRKELPGDGLISFGRYVVFGRKDYARAPLLWRMVDYFDGKALLLSDRIMSCSPFDTENGKNHWIGSYLCERMNGDNMDYAFTPEEQVLIKPNADGIRGFVLSRSEVEQVLSTDELRKAQGTTYAKVSGLSVDAVGNGAWWLRDEGDEAGCVKLVRADGTINTDGEAVTQNGIGIRPALWVDADSLELYIKSRPTHEEPSKELTRALEQFERLELDAQAFLMHPTSQQSFNNLINRYEEFYTYRNFAFQCAEADFYCNGLIEGVKHGEIHVRSSKMVIDGFIRNVEQAKKLTSSAEEEATIAHIEQEGMRRLSKLSRH